MVGVAPILYVGWKLIKRTKIIPPAEVDLVWERPIIDAYEASVTEPPVGLWAEMVGMFGIKKSMLTRKLA